MNGFLIALFKRDMLLAFRSRGDLLNPLMFFCTAGQFKEGL